MSEGRPDADSAAASSDMLLVAMAMLAVQQAVQGVAGYVDGNGGTRWRGCIENTPVGRVIPA
jgi:hypothetical protein